MKTLNDWRNKRKLLAIARKIQAVEGFDEWLQMLKNSKPGVTAQLGLSETDTARLYGGIVGYEQAIENIKLSGKSPPRGQGDTLESTFGVHDDAPAANI